MSPASAVFGASFFFFSYKNSPKHHTRELAFITMEAEHHECVESPLAGTLAALKQESWWTQTGLQNHLHISDVMRF